MLVTTDLKVLGLLPGYAPGGTTLDGLGVRYRLTVSHDGVEQPNPITKAIDIWSNLSTGQRNTAQGIFDAALAKLDE